MTLFPLSFEDGMIHPLQFYQEIPSSFSLARALKCKKKKKEKKNSSNIFPSETMSSEFKGCNSPANCCLVPAIRARLSLYVWFEENQICFYVHYDYNQNHEIRRNNLFFADSWVGRLLFLILHWLPSSLVSHSLAGLNIQNESILLLPCNEENHRSSGKSCRLFSAVSPF